jgi:hypothetical protein
MNAKPMNEKTRILLNNGNIRRSDTLTLPKSYAGKLMEFFSRKFNLASDFVHKWAKP